MSGRISSNAAVNSSSKIFSSSSSSSSSSSQKRPYPVKSEQQRHNNNSSSSGGNNNKDTSKFRQNFMPSGALQANTADDDDDEEGEPEPSAAKRPKETPSFTKSGALAVDTNVFSGRELKWNEPENMRKPTLKWRLYVFKDGAPIEKEPFRLRSPAYMFGRDRKICDIPMDHPTCSMQHAVLCFRQMIINRSKPTYEEAVEIEVSQPPQSQIRKTQPYLIDLESTNGSFVNGTRLESGRYVELRDKDVIKFGTSSREYVLLQEV